MTPDNHQPKPDLEAEVIPFPSAHHADPAADTEEARELAEFLELVRVVRESAEPDCIIEAMTAEQFKGEPNVDPTRE